MCGVVGVGEVWGEGRRWERGGGEDDVGMGICFMDVMEGEMRNDGVSEKVLCEKGEKGLGWGMVGELRGDRELNLGGKL